MFLSTTRYLAAALVLGIAGCQQSGRSISVGDTFEVIEDLRVKAEIKGTESDQQDFDCILPKGTMLRATKKSEGFDSFFSSEPAVMGGIQDVAAIEARLVPPAVRARPGYQGFYIVLSKDMIGSKLKRATN